LRGKILLRTTILAVLSGGASVFPAVVAALPVVPAGVPEDSTTVQYIDTLTATSVFANVVNNTQTDITGTVNTTQQSQLASLLATQTNSKVHGNPIQGGSVVLSANALLAQGVGNAASNGIDLSLLAALATATQGIASSQLFLGTLPSGVAVNLAATNQGTLIESSLNGQGNSQTSVSNNVIGAAGMANKANNSLAGSLVNNVLSEPNAIDAHFGIAQSYSLVNNAVSTLSNTIVGATISSANTQLSLDLGSSGSSATAAVSGATIDITNAAAGPITAAQNLNNNVVNAGFTTNSETSTLNPNVTGTALSSTLGLSSLQANLAQSAAGIATQSAAVTDASLVVDLRHETNLVTAPVSVASNVVAAAITGNNAVGQDANHNPMPGNLIDLEGNLTSIYTDLGAVTLNGLGDNPNTVSAAVALANEQVSQGVQLSSQTTHATIRLDVDAATNTSLISQSNALSSTTQANAANNAIRVGSATLIDGSIALGNTQVTDLATGNAAGLTATTSGEIRIQAGSVALNTAGTNAVVALNGNGASAAAVANVATNAVDVNATTLALGYLSSINSTTNNLGMDDVLNNLANTAMASDQHLINGGAATRTLVEANTAATTSIDLRSTTPVFSTNAGDSIERSSTAEVAQSATIGAQNNQSSAAANGNRVGNAVAYTGVTGASVAVAANQSIDAGQLSATNTSAGVLIDALGSTSSTLSNENNSRDATVGGNQASNLVTQLADHFTYPPGGYALILAGITTQVGAPTGDTIAGNPALNSIVNHQTSDASQTLTLSGPSALIAFAPVGAVDVSTGALVNDQNGSQAAGQVVATHATVNTNVDLADNTVNAATNAIALGSVSMPIVNLNGVIQNTSTLVNVQHSTGATDSLVYGLSAGGATALGISLVGQDVRNGADTTDALSGSAFTVSDNRVAVNNSGNSATNTTTVYANTTTGIANQAATASISDVNGTTVNAASALNVVNSQLDAASDRTTTINPTIVGITVEGNALAATTPTLTVAHNALTLDSNTILATTANNNATNALTVSAVVAQSDGVVVNNQVTKAASTESVNGGVELLVDSTNAGQSSALIDNTIAITNNSVVGHQFANVATNSVTVNATTSTTTATTSQGISTPFGVPGTVSVNADWAILNQQQATGNTESTVSSPLIGVDLSGVGEHAFATVTGAISVTNNTDSAVTRSNLANNAVTLTAVSSETSILELASSQTTNVAGGTPQAVSSTLNATIGVVGAGANAAASPAFRAPITVTNNTAGADSGVNDATNVLGYTNAVSTDNGLFNAQTGDHLSLTSAATVNVLGADRSLAGAVALQSSAVAVSDNAVYAQALVNQASNTLNGTTIGVDNSMVANTQETSSALVRSTVGDAHTPTTVGLNELTAVNSLVTVSGNALAALVGGNSATNASTTQALAPVNGSIRINNNQSQGDATSTLAATAQNLNIGVVTTVGAGSSVRSYVDNASTIGVANNAIKVNAFGNAANNNATLSQASTSAAGNTASVVNTQTSAGSLQAAAAVLNLGVVLPSGNATPTQDSFAGATVNANRVAVNGVGNVATNTLTVTASNALGSNLTNTPIQVTSNQISGSTVTASITAARLGIHVLSTSSDDPSDNNSVVNDTVNGNAVAAVAQANVVTNTIATSSVNKLVSQVAVTLVSTQSSADSITSTATGVSLGVIASAVNKDLTAVNSVGATVTNNSSLVQASGNTAVNTLSATFPDTGTASSLTLTNQQGTAGDISATTSNTVLGFSSANNASSPSRSLLSTLPVTISNNAITTQALGNSATNAVIKR